MFLEETKSDTAAVLFLTDLAFTNPNVRLLSVDLGPGLRLTSPARMSKKESLNDKTGLTFRWRHTLKHGKESNELVIWFEIAHEFLIFESEEIAVEWSQAE